jgi:hypothetical protein
MLAEKERDFQPTNKRTTGNLSGIGKTKLDAYRPEIEALLANGSNLSFIDKRYATTAANLGDG